MTPPQARGPQTSSRPTAFGDDIFVRDLQSNGEREQCVHLQRSIWGRGFAELVPESILNVSAKIGGVAAGAFLENEQMVGFVYGMTGVRNGRLTHWSHMLGVLSEYRGRAIGRRLKLFQRNWLLERGVTEMRWTFDPLVAGNAHFNLNHLGVRIHQYVSDMYGDTGSGIHSFGTDRFVAHWDLDAPIEEGGSDCAPGIDWDAAPVVNPDLSPPEALTAAAAPAIRIRIPLDILAMNERDPAQARSWRRATRAAFGLAQNDGYAVVGFCRSADGAACHYRLLRSPSSNSSSR